MTALEMLGWQGKVRRGVYALTGCVGLAIKHNLDRFIALSFGERWSLWSYWAPIGRLSGGQALSANDKKFLLTLFVTAIPFIWIGLTMTVTCWLAGTGLTAPTATAPCSRTVWTVYTFTILVSA